MINIFLLCAFFFWGDIETFTIFMSFRLFTKELCGRPRLEVGVGRGRVGERGGGRGGEVGEGRGGGEGGRGRRGEGRETGEEVEGRGGRG